MPQGVAGDTLAFWGYSWPSHMAKPELRAEAAWYRGRKSKDNRAPPCWPSGPGTAKGRDTNTQKASLLTPRNCVHRYSFPSSQASRLMEFSSSPVGRRGHGRHAEGRCAPHKPFCAGLTLPLHILAERRQLLSHWGSLKPEES